MKQVCNFGNHVFEDGITPEPLTQEEVLEFLSHSTGYIVCNECWGKFEKSITDTERIK